MSFLLGFLLIVALAGCACVAFLWWEERARAQRFMASAAEYRVSVEARREQLEAELETRRRQVARLAKWEKVADAAEKARQMLDLAQERLERATSEAQQIENTARQRAEGLLTAAQAEAKSTTAEARSNAKRLTEEAQTALATATARSARILDEANRKAEQIAGKAYDVVRNAELYERTVTAMRNTIRGYGDEYLKPAESLLDDLAEEFAHKDAGRQLKLAREHTQQMVKDGLAAKCEYADPSRREGAERFVLDAFNGKVDSILSRVRHDNYGTLEQEINDAFTMVNYGGRAFREARITDTYLAARLAELKWAVITQELKKQEQDEQRRFREWIREEQKAQREYEKAMREAAKEEEMLRKAMAKAEARIAAATAEQRVEYETQLAELQVKLRDAEERNQRAISMAQQTRRGHVYVISNVGSFGENIYKIGLTRRLEPLDRVKELGDASVPFDFDVHAIILSDDAPALETQLHNQLVVSQVNKVNHRKEFFRVNLAEIRQQVEELGVEAKWTMVAEAREYRETLAIERAMERDDSARDAWLNRQLTLEPTAALEPVGIEEE